MNNLVKSSSIRIVVTHFLGIILVMGACTKAPMKIASDEGNEDKDETSDFQPGGGLDISLQPGSTTKETNSWFSRGWDKITIPLRIKNTTKEDISLKDKELSLLITYYPEPGESSQQELKKSIQKLINKKSRLVRAQEWVSRKTDKSVELILKAGTEIDFEVNFFPKIDKNKRLKKCIAEGKVYYTLKSGSQTIYTNT